MSRSVPVIVVAGYLGAGKSTLLNHLLRNAHGVRIGVVVNDFGAVNIDAMLVAGQVDSTVSLSNGCLCCAVDDDELDTIFGDLAGSGMDAIVVECSGIAEPGAMVRRVLLADEPRITFGGLVYVVDGAALIDTVDTHPSMRHHLALADLVVLNKIDLAEDLDAVSALVAECAPSAPVVPAVDAAVDPALLMDSGRMRPDADGPRQLAFDDLLREEHHEHTHDGACGHLHEGYESVDVVLDRPADARAVADLLTDPPPGVFRTKGFVQVVDGTRFEVHGVGRYVRTTRCKGSGTVLVFIGRGIDADGVRARVADCGAVAGVDDPNATLALLRFSPEV
ncbi:GTP-binding protein [Tsukamurella sp. 8F]|uniref:CobW family GTP-binding protein n=1 Tax=unclassified Tsukamurella TaxID=2633480 RepID=UPI0023B8E934|nr:MULTISPECIES: GTP-binding protein [unclassified Tsukamurella]MDF0529715.1 GTP-binding protein [Tsukamurella sp. 8J]MDF0586000.1 GTP-binding protein [Tsukamurella sp. 8F]